MSTDRRGQIVRGAIDLIATSGIRALTHRAVDTRLDLPPGSTSYYFRTRHALIAAVADGITARSRADFATAHDLSTAPGEPDPATARSTDPVRVAQGIGAWLARLLTERRNELIARHALIIEVRADPDLHARLAGSLFSLDRASELCAALGAPDPRRAAGDFLALLEGLVFDRFAGLRADRPVTARELADPVSQFLTTVNSDYSQPNSE
ncbi:transcriptional regulator [Nocardia sp. AG03]|uniref:TetR/AcrR family transcriptional regulator n=1 Tax=Nocardia sp. AG03 TaxID=3025312 RepID=UPI0024188CFF|nr:transcriptional regulator [Nocardia sp. AG03]